MAADKSTSRRITSIQFNLFLNEQKSSILRVNDDGYPRSYHAKNLLFK